jgi:hypothetical protein
MADFLVELYVSEAEAGTVALHAEAACLAAEELTREGTGVRYVGSIYVPSEETCFFLYEAVSADAVREAARRGALAFDHIAEAVTDSRKGENDDDSWK